MENKRNRARETELCSCGVVQSEPELRFPPPQTIALPLIELEGPTNEAAPARAIYLPGFIVIRNIDIYVGGSGLLA